MGKATQYEEGDYFRTTKLMKAKIPVRGFLRLDGRLPGIEPELSVPQTDALTVIL